MRKYMLFALIFILTILAFLGAHAALYFSLMKFFGITTLLTRNILLWSLVFLVVSYFVATFLAHWSDNVFIGDYYLLNNLWVGLLVNLVLFFALAWGIVLISSWFHAPINPNKLLGILAIVGAIAYSAYGVWNAFTPRITSLNVAIDSLPKQWVGKKIVQISDVHLGHVYGEKYLSGVVEKINALNPEVVVITGDLFDGGDGTSDVLLAPLNKISAPVFFVTGNHETYVGIENAYSAIAKTKLIPLRDSFKNIDGLQFVGIDYPLRGADRDIAKIIPAMEGWDQFAPSVLLIHEPVQIEAAKKIGISLQLSGHTHVGQMFPFGLISHLVFKGYDFGFKRDGSYSIYTSSGLGGWGPPMRTSKKSQIVEITLL